MTILKKVNFLLLALVLTLSCGKDDEPIQKPKGSIRVTVKHIQDLVADAEVSTMPPTKIVNTDQTGTALISDVGIGNYEVEAFVNQLGEGSEEVTVIENEVTDITILLNYSMFDRPVVRLQSPVDESIHDHGSQITFAAYVADVKDFPNTLNITWSSSIDGIFNSSAADLNGNILFHHSALSRGVHEISLQAIDSDGYDFTDKHSITIQ